MKRDILPTFDVFLSNSAFSARAMTFIELVMIIVIIGILAVVALPRFETYYQIKVQAAAKKVVTDIRYVQNKAISRHADTRIIFNGGSEYYRAYYCDSDCANEANWSALQDPSTRLDLVVDFSSDHQYTGIDMFAVNFNSTDTLRFNWQGIPQDNAGSNLTSFGSLSLDYKNSSVTISVAPQTGKTVIQ